MPRREKLDILLDSMDMIKESLADVMTLSKRHTNAVRPEASLEGYLQVSHMPNYSSSPPSYCDEVLQESSRV